MHPSETTFQFCFRRGHPLVGWLFTGALLAVLLCFLSPLLAWGEQQLQGNPLNQIGQAWSQASGGAICILTGIGLVLVLTGVAAINGLCASCAIVFDKETGQITRDWQLGLLRDKESHPLTDVVAIGYTAEDTSSGDGAPPSWRYKLKCFLAGDKDYDLTPSADEETIVKLARRLQGFLGHPTDGKLRRDAWRMVEKVGAARQCFEELKEQAPNPLTGAVAGLLAAQMERLETALQLTLPAELGGTPLPDEVLERLRRNPASPDLHLQVAAQLRAQNRHGEAAAVLERGVDLYARAALAALNDSEDYQTPHREPAKLTRAHPVQDEPMRGLWEQVRLQPEEPGPYFLLAVALRTNGWSSAARGCASQAVQLRQASGAITAAEADEMLGDFPPAPFGGPPSIA